MCFTVKSGMICQVKAHTKTIITSQCAKEGGNGNTTKTVDILLSGITAHYCSSMWSIWKVMFGKAQRSYMLGCCFIAWARISALGCRDLKGSWKPNRDAHKTLKCTIKEPHFSQLASPLTLSFRVQKRPLDVENWVDCRAVRSLPK